MGKIRVLPDVLCNQIAAGEVIERPAAVAKELMENSIDAGSRKISLILSQGGRKEIRVIDNGGGMNPDDALLALERHATSKIKNVEDLQSIRSMGFRGEALPSIAAVSRFELVTREPESVSGVHIRVDGGVIRDVREIGCPPGTMVTVRDLFHNMPARRKFLRSIDTEMAHISDQFIRLAVANPEIHFQLTHEERPQYDFHQVKTMAARVGQVLGTSVAAKLRPFSSETSSARVRGLAGPPDLQKASGHSLYVCVNGRPVWDRMLHHSILSAYDAAIPKGRYPLVVLFVEVPPDLVDVNVHPTKREVRFQNPSEVMATIRTAVRSALENPRSHGGAAEQWRQPSSLESFSHSRNQLSSETQASLKGGFDGLLQDRLSSTPIQVRAFSGFSSETAPAGEGSAFTEGASETGVIFSHLRIIGQLAYTYILLEAPDGLVVVDQHAAHERIVYEQLSQEASKGVAGQRLTRSAVLELSPREAAMLRGWLGHLSRIGFEIESFGGDSFLIQAVPAVLSDYAPETLIHELFATAHEDESAPRLDLLAQLAKTAACHGSVRAGQKLGLDEMRHLLSLLDRTGIPLTCPHGRPLWYKLNFGEIARFFRRT